MSLTTAQKAAFKNEFVNDPHALGFATPWGIGNDDGVAALVNTVQQGGDFQVPREPVERSVVWAAVTPADWAAMTPEQVQKFLAAMNVPENIDLADASVLAKTVNDLPPAGGSRTAITLLQKRQGTLGEKIVGNGYRMTATDVAEVRDYNP